MPVSGSDWNCSPCLVAVYSILALLELNLQSCTGLGGEGALSKAGAMELAGNVELGGEQGLEGQGRSQQQTKLSLLGIFFSMEKQKTMGRNHHIY